MPGFWIYYPRAGDSPALRGALLKRAQIIIGGEPGVQVSPEQIWPYFIPCECKHVTVYWNAHDIEGKNRTEEWVDTVSKKLAPDLRDCFIGFSFDKALELCVDGDLRPGNRMTGFAGPP